MNIIPWGGPTVRAMAALKADSSVIFNPVVPAMLVGILWVLFVAYIFGRRERARLGIASLDYLPAEPQPASLSAAVPGNARSDLTRTSPTGRSTRTRASGRSRLKSHGCSGSTPSSRCC